MQDPQCGCAVCSVGLLQSKDLLSANEQSQLGNKAELAFSHNAQLFLFPAWFLHILAVAPGQLWQGKLQTGSLEKPIICR